MKNYPQMITDLRSVVNILHDIERQLWPGVGQEFLAHLSSKHALESATDLLGELSALDAYQEKDNATRQVELDQKFIFNLWSDNKNENK